MPRVLTAAAILLIAVTAAAQMKQRPGEPAIQIKPMKVVTPETALENAKRITRDEAIKLISEDKAVYVDIRSKASYDTGHIKGALNIPGSELMARLRELPPGKMIITYCACEKESSAARAVLQLNGHGMTNAAALIGGWHEWSALGLPRESSPVAVIPR